MLIVMTFSLCRGLGCSKLEDIEHRHISFYMNLCIIVNNDISARAKFAGFFEAGLVRSREFAWVLAGRFCLRDCASTKKKPSSAPASASTEA